MSLANIISTIHCPINKNSNLPNKAAIIYYLRLEFNNNSININSININNNNNSENGSKTAANMHNNNKVNSKMAASQPQSQSLILYKIGYTTTSINERVFGRASTVTHRTNRRTGRRIATVHKGHNGLGLPSNTNVYVIATAKCVNAATAYAKEQVLHKQYAAQRWQGLPLLANGNSELYVSDVLLLDGW